MNKGNLLKAIFCVIMIIASEIISTQTIQAQTLLAWYPLNTNLNDSTGNYGPMTVTGMTYTGGPLCVNINEVGITPAITAIDPANFQIGVDFQLNSFGSPNCIITQGPSYRWIGILANTSGYIGFSYNNGNAIYSNVQITLGTWYNVRLQYVSGHARLILDGIVVLDVCCPALDTGGSSPGFSTSDGGSGFHLRGCIKNLKFYNNPVIPAASGGSVSGDTTICMGLSTGTLTLTGNTGNIIKWQKSLNGGAWSDIANTLNTYSEIPSSTGTWTYRVNSGGCPEQYSMAATVIVSSNAGYTFSEDHSICNGDTYNWHGTNYATAGTYIANYTTVNGCDSSYTLHLTVNPVYSYNETDSICNSGDFYWHGTDYTNAGIFYDSLHTINGCDSVYALNLTVLIIDTSLTVSSPVITANATGATYQWLDCDNSYAVINGATSQSYTALANGNYAVEITKGTCSDTSSCIYIPDIGIASIQPCGFTIYPNPISDKLNIEISGNKEKTDFEILNSIGQIVLKGNISDKIVIPTGSYPPGMYLVKIEQDKKIEYKKIIKD